MALSASSAPAASAAASAANRAADAALAKANAKLEQDRRAQAAAETLRADQQSINIAAKAVEKANDAAPVTPTPSTGIVNVTV